MKKKTIKNPNQNQSANETHTRTQTTTTLAIMSLLERDTDIVSMENSFTAML